ncbi:hypothetical protein BV898_17751 [Hypsibius exemplaris]|uniref:ORC6 second cyclin-like domain-containing protein n=1 Tax=Hypsibius exemplaris TaxID=2072580 RepID=A0A9X6RN36_HYPEX|nr:hypothetical protein BV898_17751 [Hypsibius exemplaris]
MATRTRGMSEGVQVEKYVDVLANNSSLSTNQRNEAVQHAQEFLRKLKSHEQSLNALKPSFEVRYVVACDLALTLLGHHVSQERGVNASGCPAKLYQTYKALASSLLQLESGVTVKDMGIRLGVEEAIPAASELLACFKSQFGNDVYEGVPDDQFVACALYVACVKLKMRAPKRELLQLSKLKAAGFAQLNEQMTPFYKPVGKVTTPSRSGKRKVNAHPASSLANDDEDHQSTSKTSPVTSCLAAEDFEAFRLRTLRTAFEELKSTDEAKYTKFVAQFQEHLPELFPPSPKRTRKCK